MVSKIVKQIVHFVQAQRIDLQMYNSIDYIKGYKSLLINSYTGDKQACLVCNIFPSTLPSWFPLYIQVVYSFLMSHLSFLQILMLHISSSVSILLHATNKD